MINNLVEDTVWEARLLRRKCTKCPHPKRLRPEHSAQRHLWCTSKGTYQKRWARGRTWNGTGLITQQAQLATDGRGGPPTGFPETRTQAKADRWHERWPRRMSALGRKAQGGLGGWGRPSSSGDIWDKGWERKGIARLGFVPFRVNFVRVTSSASISVFRDFTIVILIFSSALDLVLIISVVFIFRLYRKKISLYFSLVFSCLVVSYFLSLSIFLFKYLSYSHIMPYIRNWHAGTLAKEQKKSWLNSLMSEKIRSLIW